MEDDDNKLHVPIPNRSSPFQAKTEQTSAFRTTGGQAGNKGDNLASNGQGLAAASASSQLGFGSIKREPDFGGHAVSGEASRLLPISIELSLDMDEAPEKQPVQETFAPVKMEHDDDDDDEDLFGDGSANSSTKGKATKAQESESMLDKRAESEKSDDEDLFVLSVYSSKKAAQLRKWSLDLLTALPRL